MNKYTIWYDAIIVNSQNRTTTEYTESHHIIPRSMGGLDSVDNRTKLTAREHFVCHWLLTKIYPTGDDHWKMLNALRIMRAENKNQSRYQTKITSRVYAKLKTEYASIQGEKMRGSNNHMYGRKQTAEARAKISAANSGDKNGSRNPGVGAKISAAQTGKKRQPFSDEWKAKMSVSASGSNNSMFNKTHSDATLQKMREKALGRKQSAETIAKKADAVRGSKREKLACTCCGELVAVNVINRWHNENCKKG